MKRFIYKLFILSFFPVLATAQSIQFTEDSVYTRNFVFNEFFNDLNSARLNSIINFDKEFNKWGVSLSNGLISNVSKLDQNFVRDYERLQFISYYKLTDKISTGAGVQVRVLSDDKNIGVSKDKSYYSFLYAKYRALDILRIESKLGYKYEEQVGEKDGGFSGLLNTELNEWNVSGYLSQARLKLFYESIGVKENNDYKMDVQIYKRFSEVSYNTGYVTAYSRKNDFFFPAGNSVRQLYEVQNNVESRTERNIALQDELGYSLGKVSLLFSGLYNTKAITKSYKYLPDPVNALIENIYNTEIFENILYARGRALFDYGNFAGTAGVEYSERNEEHNLMDISGLSTSQYSELERTEKNKNNNNSRTSVTTELLYNLSNLHSFYFNGFASILRYDTDSELNFDDRDEVNFNYSILHRYTNLDNFSLETEFTTNNSKLSYIFSERSANNYTNSIYKLTSTSYFKPVKNITTKNLFQVLANYTVYEFEDQVSQVQSFSFRQLNIKDSTVYNITKNIALNFYGELKFYEQGQFNDSSFSVRPLTYYDERTLYTEISYLFKDFLQVSLGYRYFEQKRFVYNLGIKEKQGRFLNTGPIARLTALLSEDSRIEAFAGFEKLKYDREDQNTTNGNVLISIIWNM